MISDEELEVLYQETFSECATLEDEIKMFKSLTGEHRDSLRKMYCNGLLYMISQGYTKYKQENFAKDKLIQAYIDTAKLLPKKDTFFYLVYYFFNCENQKCLNLFCHFHHQKCAI